MFFTTGAREGFLATNETLGQILCLSKLGLVELGGDYPLDSCIPTDYTYPYETRS